MCEYKQESIQNTDNFNKVNHFTTIRPLKLVKGNTCQRYYSMSTYHAKQYIILCCPSPGVLELTLN